MERAILQYSPDYWDRTETSLDTLFLLPLNNTEYTKILTEVVRASNTSLSIKNIKRYQNIHDYGQFILRGQLLLTANLGTTYYKVRRYICLEKRFLNSALEYNIDPRRCHLFTTEFLKQFTCHHNQVILVVQVITSNPNASSIVPATTAEYFVDYIVEITD